MRIVLASVFIALLLAGTAAAREEEEAPPECRYDTAGQVDYAACAAAAPIGSPWRSLSLINLGTQAFLRADYASASRYYDDAQPTNGDTFYSDPTYHAFHAATLHQVGRSSEAINEARRALAMLRNSDELPQEVRRRFASRSIDVEAVYVAILPVLHSANDSELESVRNAYLAMPAYDWVSWANRAGVLEQIGDLDGALRANAEALRLEPSHPSVLNNQCFILVRAGRAGEALPYCERARAEAPEIAAVRHSVASALAALGRCDDAEREMAEARRLDPVSAEYAQPLQCVGN